MNELKPKLINWIEDLSGSPDTSELHDLARKEKEGKIKVHDIRNSPNNPSWVVIIYTEISK